jgi:hypothetical protein
LAEGPCREPFVCLYPALNILDGDFLENESFGDFGVTEIFLYDFSLRFQPHDTLTDAHQDTLFLNSGMFEVH